MLSTGLYTADSDVHYKHIQTMSSSRTSLTKKIFPMRVETMRCYIENFDSDPEDELEESF